MYRRRQPTGRWGGWIGWVGLAGLLCIVYSWYLPQIQKNVALQAQKIALEEKLSRQEAVNRALRKQISYLQATNSWYIEKIAREQLGLARSGEAVVSFFVPAP